MNAGISIVAILFGVAGLSLPLAAAQSSAPSLQLSPTSGAIGTRITVSGSDFPAKASLQLTWDGTADGMPIVRAGGNRRFSATVVVPAAAPGSHIVAVTSVATRSRPASTTPGATAAATAEFLVVDPGDPDPSVDPSVDPGSTRTPIVTPGPTGTDPSSTLAPTAVPTSPGDPTDPVPSPESTVGPGSPTPTLAPTFGPPSPGPTVVPTLGPPAPTPSPDPTPTPTARPTATATPPTATPTPRPTATPTPTPTLTPRPTATPSPTPTPPPVNSSVRFGMAAHFMWQSLAETKVDLDRMAAANMTLARFDFSWKNSETTPGTYLYFSKLDSVLDAIAARGMRAVVTVIETPAWANGGKGAFAPPTDMQDYADFIGVLAKHNAGRSNMVWEIWNEPNDPHFWTTGPSASQYASMLKRAYASIKANDPDAVVLGGSILFNDTGFLEGIYAAGAGNSFDGLAIHPYCGYRAPSDTSNAYYSFKSSVPQFTNVMKSHGQSKAIWLTEMGWSTDKVSDATRATYLEDAVAIARTWSNVRGMAAYTMRQSQFFQFGLITAGGAETLSWKAYASAQQ